MSGTGVPAGYPGDTACSTVTWLTESIDRAIRRSLHCEDTTKVIENLIQRSKVPQYVVDLHNHSHWAVFHPDLHSGNIIVDGDWNIKG